MNFFVNIVNFLDHNLGKCVPRHQQSQNFEFCIEGLIIKRQIMPIYLEREYRSWRAGLVVEGTGCSPEDSGSVPSTHMVAHKCNSSSRRSDTLLASLGIASK